MNKLATFQNLEFGTIRSLMIDENPWFLGKDVCRSFGDKNHNRSLGRVDEEDKREEEILDSLGRKQKAIFVNESGLYSLLFAMQPQKANTNGVSYAYPIEAKERIQKLHRFKRWVTSEVLPSIRKTGRYAAPASELEAAKIKAQQDRAKAMLLNAQNRTLKTIMATIDDKKLSPIAVEVFGLKAVEQITGVDMGQHLPQCRKTYSATEIGEMLGISANKVGTIANKNHLKTEQYGITVMDKSRYSSKEVASFRYYEDIVPVIGGILGRQA